MPGLRHGKPENVKDLSTCLPVLYVAWKPVSVTEPSDLILMVRELLEDTTLR